MLCSRNLFAKLGSPLARIRRSPRQIKRITNCSSKRQECALKLPVSKNNAKTFARNWIAAKVFLTNSSIPSDPSDLKASLSDIEMRLKHQEVKLEEFGPQIDAAKQKLDFFNKDYKGRLGDYLNDPENAKRLLDASDRRYRNDREGAACLRNSSIVWSSTMCFIMCSRATKFVRLPRIIVRRCTCSSFAKRSSRKRR